MGFDMTIDRLTSQLLNVFNLVEKRNQPTVHSRTNNSSSAIAQVNFPPQSELSINSIEGNQDSLPGRKACGQDVAEQSCEVERETHSNCRRTNGSTEHSKTISVELMVHPGYPSSSQDLGCGSGADEFACSSARKHELDILSSKRMLEWLNKENIIPVSQYI